MLVAWILDAAATSLSRSLEHCRRLDGGASGSRDFMRAIALSLSPLARGGRAGSIEYKVSYASGGVRHSNQSFALAARVQRDPVPTTEPVDSSASIVQRRSVTFVRAPSTAHSHANGRRSI